MAYSVQSRHAHGEGWPLEFPLSEHEPGEVSSAVEASAAERPDGDQPSGRLFSEARDGGEQGTGRDNETFAYPPLARPLSPVWGALRAETCTPALFHLHGHVANHYFCAWLPNFILQHEREWFFKAYLESPLAFHAINYAVANHEDRLLYETSRINSAAVIAHRLEALRLLNVMISDLSTADFNMAIFAMSILMMGEPKPDELVPATLPLFFPHLRQLNCIDVIGRRQPRRWTSESQMHETAMHTLVQGAGGLQAANAGLVKVLAAGHLINVTRTLSGPRWPNPWSPYHLSAAPVPSMAGWAFEECVPGGLPVAAVSAFTNLSLVDEALSDREAMMNDDRIARLRLAVNDAHYLVMSLKSWEDLDDDARGGSYLATYECCRLAAILYSICVLFPLPTSSGCHAELLKSLRNLVETSRLPVWRTDVTALSVWVLWIASMAAFETPHSTFFESTLRKLLITKGLTQWHQVRSLLGGFMWSDSACGQGAMVMWDRLDPGDVEITG